MSTETTTRQLLICENDECNHLHYFENRVEAPIEEGKTQLECPICEHPVYMECDHWLEWGHLHEKWAKNLTLYYVESNSTHYDTEEQLVLDSIKMSFALHNSEYMMVVSRKDVEEDSPSIVGEGDSDLFESMVDLLEDEHWEKVKMTFGLFEKWYTELNNTDDGTCTRCHAMFPMECVCEEGGEE